MARTARKPKDDGEAMTSVEYKRPDAKRALEIYDDHIAPKQAAINTIKGDMKEPWQMVKDEANCPKKEMSYVQSLVDEEDDLKRDHRLRALRNLLIERGLSISPDLVDTAEGHNSADIIPFSERANAPFLPGVSDGGDED